MKDKHILQFFNDLFAGDINGQIYFTEAVKSKNDALVHPSKVLDFLKLHNETKPLFFTPNLFQQGTIKEYGKGRVDHNVRIITCLFWDFDSFRIDEDYLKERGFPSPTYLFRRGDRAHIYYVFDKPILVTSSLDPLAKTVTKILKTGQKILGADPAPAHLGSIIRVPGTAHVKNGKVSPGYELPIREGKPKKFKLKDFNFVLQAAGATQVKENKKTKRTDGFSDDEIKKLLLDSHNIITAGAGRSNAIFRFGLRCRDWGLPEEKALEVGSKFNDHYCKPPEESSIVEHQIRSAYKYANGPAGKLLTKAPDLALDEFRTDLHVGYSLREWVFVQQTSTLNHLTKPIIHDADQIGTALSFLTGLPIKLSYVVGNRLIQVCDKMSFRPDKNDRVWEENGVSYFNTYAGLKKVKPSGNEIHVKRFCDHLKYMTSNEEEYEHLLKYISTSLCYPQKKIKHAVLMVSRYQGTGKSSFQTLFETILQSESGHSYVSQGNNSAIAKGYNEFMDSKLITFFHDVGQDKYHVMDEVKSWITEKTIRINGKFTRNYFTDNYTQFFMSANNINALPLEPFDRRFFVIECREKPKNAEYYKNLNESFTVGAGDIFQFLSKFKDELNIESHPPTTYSKQLMQAQSKSEVAIILDELYEEDDPIFDSEITLKSLIDTVYMAAPASARSSITQKAVSRWLLANGWQHRQKGGKDRSWKYYPPEKKKKKKAETEDAAKGVA